MVLQHRTVNECLNSSAFTGQCRLMRKQILEDRTSKPWGLVYEDPPCTSESLHTDTQTNTNTLTHEWEGKSAQWPLSAVTLAGPLFTHFQVNLPPLDQYNLDQYNIKFKVREACFYLSQKNVSTLAYVTELVVYPKFILSHGFKLWGHFIVVLH